MKRRAFSLAYVLTLCALAFLLVGLAVTSTLQLQAREQHQRDRQQAILYAKSGLERAVARLAKNSQWGKVPSDNLAVPALAGHPVGAGALVTFDPASPDACVNHFDQDGDPAVPKNTVHLWSVGKFRGAKVRLEASLAKPNFPFVVASSGPIKTSGAFFAGTVERAEDADLPLSSPEFLKRLKQASLLSNGSMVSLQGSPVHITGDLVCAGSVDLGPDVQVDGEVRRYASKKPIPAFDVASFDTLGKPLLNDLSPGDLQRSDPLTGYARCDGNLRVLDDLRLDEAILYVNGDLRVTGRLSGKGALFVRGNVVVESTALGALDEVAVIAGGSMTVTGVRKERSKLVGLLVSCGDLSLSDITVVGAVVCAGTADRELRFSNVNAIGSPEGVKFEFEVGWGLARTSYTVTADPARGTGGGLVRLAKITDPSTGVKHDARPADFVGRYDKNNPSAPLLRDTDFEVVLADGSVTTLAAAGIAMSNVALSRDLLPNLEAAVATQATTDSKYVSQGRLSLDLNKFLRVGDDLQVVYRRIY